MEGGFPGPLRAETAEEVLQLTLARPEKRNALSIELRRRLARALEDLDTERVGAVVITGAPPAFCSGMDTTQFGGDTLESKRRVLLERETLYGFLFEDEERMFRNALAAG